MRLFPEHDAFGVGGDEGRRDEHLGLTVGVGDEVTGVLLVDLAVGKGTEAGVDDLGGDVLQEGEHGIRIHTPNVVGGGRGASAAPPDGRSGERADVPRQVEPPLEDAPSGVIRGVAGQLGVG